MVRALDALGPLGSLDALGPLGSLHALGTLDALVSLYPRNALGTLVAAINSSVFTAVFAALYPPVFAALGALLALRTQLDPQAIVVLAQPHALKVQLASELPDGLRNLLALLRRQTALADAHVAHTAVEERADLGDELLDVDHAGGVARNVELGLFTSIFTTIFTAILTAIFPPVFLAYVRLGERPDRLRQWREQSDGRNSRGDEAFARHGSPFKGG